MGNFEIYNWLNQNGIENSFPINPGGKFEFDFGTVKCVAAQHPSSFADGRYGGIASGFVLTTPDGNFYYSGDTALTIDMQLIPKWAKLDFAVFPIGDLLTMGVEEAIEAAKFVGVTKVMGVHYHTFGLIKIDTPKAEKDFNDAGIFLFYNPVWSQKTKYCDSLIKKGIELMWEKKYEHSLEILTKAKNTAEKTNGTSSVLMRRIISVAIIT